MKGRKRTPEERDAIIARARTLRAAGVGWKSIAKQLGTSTEFLWWHLKPGYAEERREKVNAHRRKARPSTFYKVQIRLRDCVEADATRLMAQIPPDTRDFTARVCGDPLPGRSALDQKQTEGGSPCL